MDIIATIFILDLPAVLLKVARRSFATKSEQTVVGKYVFNCLRKINNISESCS